MNLACCSDRGDYMAVTALDGYICAARRIKAAVAYERLLLQAQIAFALMPQLFLTVHWPTMIVFPRREYSQHSSRIFATRSSHLDPVHHVG